MPTEQFLQSDKMDKLRREKKGAVEFQERKHPDWNENYELSRNKVRTNRLTQRQAVNIPLMKETEKTLLSRIDDPPTVDWKEKGGDELKQLYFQEIWNQQFKTKKFEWKDTLDKKNVLRTGLSTKMLNLGDNCVEVDIMDAWDILYDPMMNPINIESARYIIRQNIFRSLRNILADDRYSDEGKEKLKTYLTTGAGLVQSGKMKEEFDKRNERIKTMGVLDSDFPLFAGGDVMVNLSEHYTELWDDKKKEFVRHVIVYANDTIELMDETLVELIGVTFWQFVMWAEDPETNDVYPDSIDDLVRVPNKILNVWFSQMVENRTLRNFQMHWYDASIQGYTPQTYEPGPGRMLPAPGSPKDTIQAVEVDGLDETLNAMEYVTQVVERATGATAIEKGVGEQQQQTLGEVKILMGQANERATAMTKFYRNSWYELAQKWYEIMEANPPSKIELYKTSKTGKMYSKIVYKGDWMSDWGYEPIVRSTSEQESETLKGVQKFQFVQQMSPTNTALRNIALKRSLELLDLTPEELKEVEASEKDLAQQEKMAAQAGVQPTQQGQGTPSPMQPQQGVNPDQLQELSSLMQ